MRITPILNYRPRESAADGHSPVIVAVTVVWMMQMSTHEIVEVIPVGDGLVPAVRAVDVR